MLARINSSLAELQVNPRYQYAALGLITLLAALLRFYKLGEWSFWIDEIYTIGRAQAHYGSLEAILRNIPPNRNWIPLSVMLTAGTLNALGTSEWSARLVSATIGVISIPVLYFPIRRLFGPAVGLVAAFLLAMSPWHIYWSQNARFYTSLMLLYSLALFSLYFGLERDRPGYLLLSVLLVYLATSERLFALFIMPVMACYLLLLKMLHFKTPPGLRARNLGLLILPAIGASILEAYGLLTSGTSRFFGDFGWFLLHRVDDPFRLFSFTGYAIGIPLLSLALFGGLYLTLQKSRAGLLIFTAAVVPVALLLLLNPFIFTKDRYVFVTLPCWIVLSSVAVKELFYQVRGPGRVLAIGVMVLLLADAAGALLPYYTINDGNRRDWRGAFALVQDRKAEEDLVVSTRPELGTYYLSQEVVWMGELTPEGVIRSGKRVWFVTDSESVWTTGSIRPWVEENGQLVDLRYLRVPEDISLRIYLYDPGRDAVRE